MSRNMVLLQVLADGTTQEFPLSQLQVIQAQANAKYVLLDKASGKALDVVMTQQNDDAELLFEGERIATLEGYFDEALSAEVAALDSVVQINDALIQAEAGELIGAASSADPNFEWSTTDIVMATVLGLGSADIIDKFFEPDDKDTTPPEPPTFALNSDTGSSAEDNITSDVVVNVGNLEPGASWEYSLDGGVTFVEGAGTSFNLDSDATYAVGDIQVRQTDRSNNVSDITANEVEITTDNTVAAPGMALAADTGSSNSDGITNDQTVNVTLASDVASWEYSTDGGVSFADGDGTSFELAANTTYSASAIQVRQTDVAGNTSTVVVNAGTIETDSTVAAPGMALAADTGSSNSDGITNDQTVNVTLASDVASWEYSTNGGASFTAGTGTSFELAANATYSASAIRVRQTDVAGNTSTVVVNAGTIETDTTVAAPGMALATDTGSSNSDGITSDQTVNVTLASDVASWEYSTNGGASFTAGTGTSFELAANTSYSTSAIQVRQTDVAGNTSTVVVNSGTIETDNTVAAPGMALAADTGSSNSDGITNDQTVNVTLASDVASWEYSTNGGASFTAGTGTSFELAANTSYSTSAIQVRQTDVAGNTSTVVVNSGTIETDTSAPSAPSMALATDTGSSNSDGITSDQTVNVTGLEAGASWEYSTNGGASFTAGTGTSFELAANATYSASAIQVRQTDVAGNTSTAVVNAGTIETDTTVAAPGMALAADTGSSNSDGITNDQTVNVTLASDVASWEYSTNGGASFTAGTGTSFELAANTSYSTSAIQVRQTDVAGNTSTVVVNSGTIETDTSAPSAPSMALATDTGSSNSDGITSDQTVNVTGLEAGASWEYSTNGGASFTAGTGTSFELAANASYSTSAIQVRQTDVAGNTSTAVVNAGTIETDTTVAAPGMALATDAGSSNSDGITNDQTVNVTLASDVASWEYSTNGGASFTAGTGTSFELAANATYSASAIQVRQTDVAGNTSTVVVNSGTIETDTSAPSAPSMALATDTGSSNSDGITSDQTVNVTGLEAGASWEYSTNGGVSFAAGTGTSFELAANTTYAASDIQVRQTDVAGNTSSVVSNGSVIVTDSTAPTSYILSASYDAASDTITLTGKNINSLLSSGETSSTNIKGNLDWTKFEWDVDSDDTGNITFTEADISSAVATNDTTLTIVLGATKATAIEGATGYDDLSGDDTLEIGIGFSGDSAGNTSASDWYDGAADTSVVVFDLIGGQSSMHSGREFDASTSYTIYVRVDSDAATLTAAPAWAGGGNLGADDTVVLVGDGSAVIGRNGNGAISWSGFSSGSIIWWTQVAGANWAASIKSHGAFTRTYLGGRNTVDLWSGTVVGTAAGGLATTIPVGVMTSQGLV